jgi:cysteinyl-tRNA synthetase
MKKETISAEDHQMLKSLFHTFTFDILGLKEENGARGNLTGGLMDLILSLRQKARETKDWATSDQIREALSNLNIVVKDGKDGSTWNAG